MAAQPLGLPCFSAPDFLCLLSFSICCYCWSGKRMIFQEYSLLDPNCQSASVPLGRLLLVGHWPLAEMLMDIMWAPLRQPTCATFAVLWQWNECPCFSKCKFLWNVVEEMASRNPSIHPSCLCFPPYASLTSELFSRVSVVSHLTDCMGFYFHNSQPLSTSEYFSEKDGGVISHP